MKFKLNCSPHLRMHEITKKLFNRNFLSDIQFLVDGKTIYAHSLELMKRSVTFEEQLHDTWGKKKLIPVTDCNYGSFLEFIRFIYTDKCTINSDNGMNLLKLAIKYQVVMLENRVINSLLSNKWTLQVFDYCVIENYQAVRHHFYDSLVYNIKNCLKNQQFLSIHPKTLDVILQFDGVREDMTEINIFNALAKWIDNYCQQHSITLTDARQQFDHLIRKVRFPTMSSDEIRDCVKNYPELINQNDRMSIGAQMMFGNDNVNTAWISNPRRDWEYQYEWRKTNRDTTFESIFSVSKATILNGLWIGVETNRKYIKIEIQELDTTTNKIEKIQFTQSSTAKLSRLLISMGNSICLKPNCKYTIVIKYLNVDGEYTQVICRQVNVGVHYSDPENVIQFEKVSDNIHEILFKSTSERIY